MTKCAECGGRLQVRRENYKYDMSGLPHVTLVGVDVARCRDCGEYEVAIPRLAELHRMLAGTVVRKSSRLTGAEIVFLRKHLGLTSTQLATCLGTTRETVSRWEHEATIIGAVADRLLRLLLVVREALPNFDPSLLERIAEKPRPIPSVKLQAGPAGWRAADVAA